MYIIVKKHLIQGTALLEVMHQRLSCQLYNRDFSQFYWHGFLLTINHLLMSHGLYTMKLLPLPLIFLKETAVQIAPALSLIFQASIDQGILPSDWKEANVVPIHKKGNRSTAANYRPVSLTSIYCKILEHIIYSSLIAHLDEYNALTDCQHGFRKRHSVKAN